MAPQHRANSTAHPGRNASEMAYWLVQVGELSRSQRNRLAGGEPRSRQAGGYESIAERAETSDSAAMSQLSLQVPALPNGYDFRSHCTCDKTCALLQDTVDHDRVDQVSVVHLCADPSKTVPFELALQW